MFRVKDTGVVFFRNRIAVMPEASARKCERDIPQNFFIRQVVCPSDGEMELSPVESVVAGRYCAFVRVGGINVLCRNFYRPNGHFIFCEVDPEHFTLRNNVVHETCYVMDKDQIVTWEICKKRVCLFGFVFYGFI